MSRYSFLPLVAVFSFWCSSASAQFVGDTFFQRPSIAIPVGSTAELTLAVFVGDTPFGSAEVRLQFDPALIRIEKIEPGNNGGNDVFIESNQETGVVILSAMNPTSLTDPIGTVVISRLTVRPLGAIGQRAVITSSPRGALSSGRTLLRKGTGFGAEVTVTSAAATSSSIGSSAQTSLATSTIASQNSLETNSALGRRALALRPAGQRVLLFVSQPNGRIEEIVVVVPNKNSPRD
jgi:hypothetical protein